MTEFNKAAAAAGAADSSLSLNIVAIPPPNRNAAQSTTGDNNNNNNKKKRLNKYDKRRRKSQNKKEQETQKARSNGSKLRTWRESQNDPPSQQQTKAEADLSLNLAGAGIASENGKESPGTASAEELSNREEQANESDNDDDDHVGSESSDSAVDHAADVADASASHPELDPLHDDEARAKYLAEFHARPMELDRRAGANASRKMVKSRDSAHLFAKDLKWTDLPLHERLVSCLHQQLRHDQPTVVQSRSILAFAPPSSSSSSDAPSPSLHNLLIKAETGSGKTLAYLLPIIQRLAIGTQNSNLPSQPHSNSPPLPPRTDRRQSGTRCIVLCPTRELASQTFAVAEQLCATSFNWIVPGCLLGEERRKSEKARLRKGLSIVVATPGRLLDHLVRTESLLMSLKGKLEWLVLDEADRLLDMGLGDQVQQIVQRIRANQPGSGSGRNGVTWRSVLVSATVTPRVERLAKETLIGGDNSWVWIQGGDEKKILDGDEPVPTHHANGDGEESAALSTEFAESTPHQLTQMHMTVSAKLRLPALIAFLALRAKKQERTVVFLSTCASVDYFHALFRAMEPILRDDDDDADPESETGPGSGLLGRKCCFYKLHGSVPHGERQQTLRRFIKVVAAQKQAAVLFATDVASRGLNLPDVDWIVQYDPPGEVAEYVHRAGRVARAGKAGHSLLFLLPSETAFLDILKKRGVKRLSALSLSSTLKSAADACKQTTTEGMRHAGGGTMSGFKPTASSGRIGEAFASEVQRRLEAIVSADDAKVRATEKAARKNRRTSAATPSETSPSDGLMELARNAFVSHLRSYPTKEKLVRHIFSAKALHLGHVARSFALKEPPKRLATIASKQTAVVVEQSETRKRNTAMAFGSLDDGGAYGSDNAAPQKRSRPSSAPSSKSVFLSKAKKLQTGGLDGL